ncbi:MAG: hypothetical protein EBS19_04375 [Spirochaetia bacterium]|nr:hypothetical protein [Spirochaetia bacterium]
MVMQQMFDEMVEMQRKKILQYGRQIIPYLTADDVLQPNDFPQLESHPEFRYEEGVLEGLLSARMAYLAQKKTRSEDV